MTQPTSQHVGQESSFEIVSAGVWSRSHRLLTVGIILTVAGAAFEALAVATTLPATVKELGGLSLYGWAFSAFLLTNLIGTTVAGGEADRHGPARPFIVGVALFVAGLLTAGLAPSMPVVILGRAVQGFGAGAIGAIAYVAVGKGYPEAARARMLALLSTAWVVPGLIGPAIAGQVAELVGWRWVFLGLAPMTPLAAALAVPALRRLPHGSTAARDWSRISAALRLTVGAGLAMAALSVGSLLPAILLMIGGMVAGVPALRRLLPPGTLRAAPGLPAAIATGGLVNMVFFGVDAFVPLALTSVRGQGAAMAGLALTAATITWTTGAWIQERVIAPARQRLLVTSGLGLITLGSLGAIAGIFPSVPVLVVPAAWGVAGLGMGLAFSTISLVVLERANPGEEGTASSAMQVVNVLGSAFGTGIGGVFVAYTEAHEMGVGAGIVAQDVLMIVVAGLAVYTAMRLGSQAGAPVQSTTARVTTDGLAV